MATASRTRLVLAALMVSGAAALVVAPGGAAQVLPLPLPVPSPTPLSTATPTALPGPGVQPPQPPSPPQICRPSVSTAPPSCPQAGEPHLTAPRCTMPLLGPNELRVVADLVPTPVWWWGASLAVDPSNPCHLYTGGNAISTNAGDGYPQTVYRGDTVNGMTSWAPVFTAPTQTGDTLLASYPSVGHVAKLQPLPAVGPTGTVWLAATTDTEVGLTHVFRSNDVGAHWDERDNGFLTQAPNSEWARTLAAPSDPKTIYVVTAPRFASGPTLLHATHDGGATWTTAPLPDAGGSDSYALAARLAVDPSDASSLYFIPPSSNTLWLSSDGGMQWHLRVGTGAQLPPPGVGPNGNTDPVVVTHTPGRGVQLYVHASNQWWGSADQGASWYGLQTLADEGTGLANGTCYRPCSIVADGVPESFLAADPTDPNVLVWVNGGTSPTSGVIDIWVSTDGFATLPSRRLQLAVPPDATGMTVESLQADPRGDFYLALERCSKCPQSVDYASPTASTVLAFRASAVQAGGGSRSFGSSQLVNPQLNPWDVRIPPPSEPPSLMVANCVVTPGGAGSIAFDGRFVDYTQDDTPAGEIFRLDAAGCAAVPALVLNPADFPSRQAPALLALTYDARYAWPGGRVGALLGSAPAGFDPRLPPTQVPIYAIDPVTGASVLKVGVDTSVPPAKVGDPPPAGCQGAATGGTPTVACPEVSFFSSDVFRDGIWSLGTSPSAATSDSNVPGFLSPEGTFHDTCFSPGGVYIAAAVVGGNGYLYVLWEDDLTIVKISADTCQRVGGFQLADKNGPTTVGENPNEEEQIACDPLSFSTPVIWVRNSTLGTAAAYPAPDAVCPFLTRLSYSGPAEVIPGHSMTLCYTLEATLAGIWQPAAGQPIDVRVAGTTVGHALTDRSGHACITKPSSPSFGGSTVTGDFGGTAAYLPATATGLVVVPGGPGTGTNGPAGPLTSGAPPIPPPPPGPQSLGEAGTQFQADAGTQTMAQAQTQAQSQAQSQSVAQAQPGVVLQHQRRTQVAIQEQGAQMNVAYEATALHRGRPGPAVAVAAALMILGCGLAWRKPGVALGRATRGRGRA